MSIDWLVIRHDYIAARFPHVDVVYVIGGLILARAIWLLISHVKEGK
jgi:hypothetical protein